jgi:hypothetical protein
MILYESAETGDMFNLLPYCRVVELCEVDVKSKRLIFGTKILPFLMFFFCFPCSNILEQLAEKNNESASSSGGEDSVTANKDNFLTFNIIYRLQDLWKRAVICMLAIGTPMIWVSK